MLLIEKHFLLHLGHVTGHVTPRVHLLLLLQRHLVHHMLLVQIVPTVCILVVHMLKLKLHHSNVFSENIAASGNMVEK